MIRKTTWTVAILIAGLSLLARAQGNDADAQAIADQYQAAFNRGDAKGIGALYTANATRVGPDGQLITGRAAIEKLYADGFAGPLKGAKITLQSGLTQTVTPDVKIIEGRFETVGGMSNKGRYVNTIVRQGGHWLLASVVTVPDLPK